MIRGLAKTRILIMTVILAGFYFLLKDRLENREENNHPISVGTSKGEDLEMYQTDIFSFQYPKGFVVNSHPVSGGGKIVAERITGQKEGFQIAFWPFDETGPLTIERIKKDIPDIEINNFRNIEIATDFPAVAFESADEIMGRTFEVWFIYKEKLYQVMTYPTFAEQMEKILTTLRFE